MKHHKYKKESAREIASAKSAVLETENDFKDALLIVSITANLFVLSLWVALQTTNAYDYSLTSFFISR